MINAEFEVGKTYLVTHGRKGTFAIKVISQDEEWVDGLVAAGHAGAMLAYNEREVGEDITLRKSFITNCTEQPEETK